MPRPPTRNAARLRPILVALALCLPRLAWAEPGLVLQLSSAGARVLVDGREVAPTAGTELVVPIASGDHAVRVEKDGFEPFEQAVRVEGAPLTVSVYLRPVAASKAAVRRVALQAIRPSQGVDERTASLLTESLLAELRKVERLSVIGMNEVAEMLGFEAQRQLAGCDDSTTCLADIGGALGVDELVTALVGRLGDSSVVTLRRTDIGKAQVIGSTSKRLATGNGEEFFAVIGPAVAELYPDLPLKRGRTRGVGDAFVARLHPPPLPAWVFWTTAATTLVAGAASGVAALRHQDALASFDTLTDAAGPVAGADVVRLQAAVTDRAREVNIALGVSAALAVATVATYFFTDWNPAVAESTTPPVSIRVTPLGVAVAFR